MKNKIRQTATVYQKEKQRLILKIKLFHFFLLSGLFLQLIQVQASDQAIGNISGQFDVSPTGAALYSVPIECPVGVNGMVPNISLTYNSQSGNGIAGWGWNINGISVISRINKNLYFDNCVSGIQWGGGDSIFVLDGQRLIRVAKIDENTIEYRTESDGYDKIISYKNSLIYHFKVYTRDGRILTYSPILKLTEDDNTLLWFMFNQNNMYWHLSSAMDRNGNEITYTYDYERQSFWLRNFRLSKISYGGNTVAGTSACNEIEFLYENRPDTVCGYIAQRLVSQPFRLKTIQTKTNNTLLRKYDLNYQVCEIGKSRLAEIKLSNAAGESLPPIKIDWYASEINIKEKLTDIRDAGTNYPIKDKRWFSIDFNGDGVTDLINISQREINLGGGYYDYLTYFEFFKSSNTYGEEKFEYHKTTTSDLISYNSDDYKFKFGELKSCYFYDIDCPRILIPYLQRINHGGMDFSYLLFVDIESSRNFHVPLQTKTTAIPVYQIADINNDGYDDVVIIEQFAYNGTFPIHIAWGRAENSVTKVPASHFSVSLPQGTIPQQLSISDLNGNGLKDLLILTNYGYCTVFNKGGKISERGIAEVTFEKWQAENFSIPYLSSGGVDKFPGQGVDYLRTGDFNGDGLTDMIFYNRVKEAWFIAVNTGSRFDLIQQKNLRIMDEVWKKEIVRTPDTDVMDHVIIMDVDNDGKTDIVVVDALYASPTMLAFTQASRYQSAIISWYLSDGKQMNLYKQVQTEREVKSNFNITGDFNGDGFTELLSYSCSLIGNINPDNRFHIHYNKDILNACRSVFMITDCMNNQRIFLYDNLTEKSIYSVSGKKYDKVKEWKSPLCVLSLSGFVTYDEFIFKQMTSYEYKDALYHTQGKGFLGFKTMIVDKNQEKIVKETTNNLNTEFFTLVPCSTSITVNGKTVNTTEQNISVNPLGDKRFSLQINSIVEKDLLKGTSVTTSFSDYSKFGIPRNTVTDYGGGIWDEQKLTLREDGTWKSTLPLKKTVEKVKLGTHYSLNSEYAYDENGNLVTSVTEPGNILGTSVSYTYDVFGNKIEEKRQCRTISLLSETSFSPCGRFPKSHTDQLKQTTIYNYNKTTGLLTSLSDNTGTTIFRYDGFGRKSGTDTPDGLSSSCNLFWDNSIANAKYKKEEMLSGSSPVWTWYDSFGREIQRASIGLNGKKQFIRTVFDHFDRVGKISTPFGEGEEPVWEQINTYDEYGRLSAVNSPIGETTYSYLPLRKTTTSPAGTRTDYYNNCGQKTKVNINGKNALFEYHASGQMKSARPAGGAFIFMEYDIQGNRIKLDDPDAGEIFSEYDGFGNLTKQIQTVHETGKTITTEYKYDSKNGLLLSRTRNGEKTSYDYDSRKRLISENIEGKHRMEYAYDKFNRKISTTETIDEKQFTFRTDYDMRGRVSRKTYPTGYFITNDYDQNGHLKSVWHNGRTLLWEARSTNERGRLTEEKFGTLIKKNEYDEVGRLISESCGGWMNRSYVFDDRGLLVEKKDNNSNQTETYTYDNLNRLTGWTVNNGHSSSSYLMEYDGYGNISSKPEYGYRMTYGENGLSQHSISSLGISGDNAPGHEQFLTYTDFRKVASISEGQNSLQLTYGIDHQRRKGVFSVNGNPTLTRYYFGNYEEDIDAEGNVRKIHYISGGNGIAAIFVKHSNGKDSLYYTLTDYQSNLLAVKHSESGKADILAYDPWGNRRNPDDWMSPDTDQYFFSRGYTMHEHLEPFGLINMNGRMYDPRLSQFLAPDPYIQTPENWLNYNRYAYCMNNPVMYNDPTGESVWAAIGLGMVINLAVQGMSGNINNFGDFMLFAGIGAVGGAVGYGIGAGLTSALGCATSLGSAVASGAIIGGGSGFAGGLFTGMGNALKNGTGTWNAVESAFYGSVSGILVGGLSKGFQFAREDKIFRTVCEEMKINPEEAVPANDEFLKRAQEMWYRDAPMENVRNFSVENVPEYVLKSFEKNPKAAARTIAYHNGGVYTGKSSVYFNKNLAFTSAKQLYFSMGHEFVHVSQYAYIGSINGTTVKYRNNNLFINMIEHHAYGFESSLGGSSYQLTREEMQAVMKEFGNDFVNCSYHNFGWTQTLNFKYPF